MTTIEYGGGPNIDQRREFSGLKEDAYIPGYQGHCPQLKYSIGKTYGLETSELNQVRRCRRHQLAGSSENAEEIGLRHQFGGSSSLIPESTGDNKYTQNMVPGYTGYVPRWPYKFGRTYKEECDLCLAEFFSGCRHTSQMENEMKTLSKSLSDLRAISSDPEVKDRLNAFGDRKGTFGSAAYQHRQQTEAPMPGYRGYVPRIRVTELGLGSRYHEASQSGLDSFYTKLAERSQRLGTPHTNFGARRLEPITINRNPMSATASNGQRVYIQDGMIPKYTGFVPQQRYAIGNTYGDETRSLEVCAHDQPSFGAYVKLHGTSLSS